MNALMNQPVSYGNGMASQRMLQAGFILFTYLVKPGQNQFKVNLRSKSTFTLDFKVFVKDFYDRKKSDYSF